MKAAGNENHGEGIARSAMPQAVRALIGRSIAFKVARVIAIAIATSSEYCLSSLE
jgi:hypothetical protein